MMYEELHQKYGNHIAKRVQQELSNSEFQHIPINNLIHYLEDRAETAHQEYRVRMNDPFTHEKLTGKDGDVMDRLYRRWCNAEDLAYLLTVAEDVSTTAHSKVAH